jgi:GT2 family glycosyltransferase
MISDANPIHSPRNELPPVSILICTKGNHADAIVAVNSIQNCGYPLEKLHIVILEETDAPQPISGTDYHTLPLLHKGFGYARNQSLQLAKHELVAFIDDDCIAEPNWLETLVQPLIGHDEILATAGLVRLPECGPIGECENILGFPGGGVKLLHRSGGLPIDVATFSTCSSCVRLRAIRAAGGFDESRRFGREDEELSRYIAQNGRIRYAPDSVVRHAPRDRFRAIWPWFFRRGRAAGECGSNQLYFLRINIWLRLIAAILLCKLIAMPLPLALPLLIALHYLNIRRRFRWARAYYPRRTTHRILPLVSGLMDAAMSAGVLYEWIRKPSLLFKRKSA